MATQLTHLGVIPWISKSVANFLKKLSLGLFCAFSILQILYFFIHYLFASQIARVGALYSAFLSMLLASKVSDTLAASVLMYSMNLFGALTHYSSGQAALYHRAGYVKLHHVLTLGITMVLVNLTIWGLADVG